MWRLSPAERLVMLGNVQASRARLVAFLTEHHPTFRDGDGSFYIERPEYGDSWHHGQRAVAVAQEYMAGERRFVIRSGSNFFLGLADPVRFTDAELVFDGGYGSWPETTFDGNECWSLRRFANGNQPRHAAALDGISKVLTRATTGGAG